MVGMWAVGLEFRHLDFVGKGPTTIVVERDFAPRRSVISRLGNLSDAKREPR